MAEFEIQGVAVLTDNEDKSSLTEEDIELLREYVLHLKKENERLQKELSLLLLSQITENDQKLGLYEGTIYE